MLLITAVVKAVNVQECGGAKPPFGFFRLSFVRLYLFDLMTTIQDFSKPESPWRESFPNSPQKQGKQRMKKATFICRCCGGDAMAVWSNKRFMIARCGSCSIAFTEPLPREEELNALYSDNYYSRDSTHQQRLNKFFAQRADEVSKLLSPQARLLDFGAGAGEFVKACLDQGLQAEGIEFSESAIKLASSRGIPVYQHDLVVSSYTADSFDCITMWDVIAHLLDPHSTLHQINRLLKKGGWLVVKTPNFPIYYFRLAQLLQLAGNTEAMFGLPNSMFFFHAMSLRQLLLRCSFTVESIHCLGPLRGKLPKEYRTLKGRIYAHFISALRLLGHRQNLLAYARKVV
jgi:2-polyprenyl-3-methyl-5-hydroxy-6-metoxy-1,4-benzoquinol methylase